MSSRLTADTFGCEEQYFKKFIKGKPLEIVSSHPNNYIRVKDQNQEEWALFDRQYTVITGIGDAAAPAQKEKSKDPMVPQAAT